MAPVTMLAVDDLGFGILLGFSLTIPPGPMNALIAARSVRSLRAGTVTGLGALSADLVLGTIIFALRSTIDLASFVRIIYALGSLVMVVLGVLVLRGRDRSEEDRTPGLRAYSQAIAIGVTNPFQILWWLTAGLAFAFVGGIILFVGLFGAIAIWVVVFPWVVHRGTLRYPKLRGLITIVSVSIMFGFAIYFALLAILV
jgi:threonine/homoserine/homoserine lactone efflux protein